MSDEQFDKTDFFGTKDLIDNPYPYLAHLRNRCPVVQEPFRDVFMVTGFDEAVEVYHDQVTFSACNSAIGPFARFPVPLEGDDVTEIIETYRDGLPFGDQLPTFDPPKHTAQRGLLMRLITPKRLKENEAALQRLADDQIDAFHARGECEFVGEYAQPYTMLVIADLLGVPEEDHPEFLEKLMHTGAIEMTHSPLEYLYAQFTRYIEDRRREPRDDVMTGLATATFPDGSLPPVVDVMKIASNLFAAGQETTARLLGTALMTLGEQPGTPTTAPGRPQPGARLHRGDPSACSPRSTAPSACLVHRPPSGTPRSPPVAPSWCYPAPPTAIRGEFEDPDELRLDRENGRQHIAFGHGIHTCAGAPLARAEANVSLQRLLDRMGDIRISDAHHGPAGDRHWEYTPTWMLRGHDRLFLEFTPIG